LINPSLQKLHKFLKLETERNYDNRAVVGGMERMLEPWEAEARANILPEEVVQVVVTRLREYPALGPDGRAKSLDNLWQQLQSLTGETLPPLPIQVPERAVEAPPKSEPVTPSPLESSLPPAELVETLAQPTEGKPEKRKPPASSSPPAALNASITVLPGVGPRHGQTLSRLGLRTLGDMLYYFPRRYDDYSKLKPINRLWYGEDVTVIGIVESVTTRTIRSGRLQVVEAVISDGTGSLRITWFNPYIAKRIRNGMQVSVSGKIEQYLGRLVMNNPEVEPVDQQNLHTNRIVPVYPLTANITQRWLRRLMFQVVSYWASRIQDILPESIRQSADLASLPTALLQAHFPDSWDQLKAARYRLAFDEIFLLQSGVLRQKRAWQNRNARIFDITDEWLDEQVARLPFRLTAAQQRALQDVRHDLSSGRPMNRLLQGDVGSGKTVIAALGIAMLARHGAQSALMAPTSILAEQHYRSLLRLLSEIGGVLRPEQIRSMIGSTPDAEKRLIRDGLASGEIKVVVGTHALIEDPITFADLQLAVIDEQHRFGVEQRALLRSKGDNPHLLVMTATPIPRSLALTIYGDLDLSLMDEMPPGRQIIETQVFYPRERERAYTLIRSQIAEGHQAFIIYPLVEESENSEALAAVEEYTHLQKEIFPHQKLALLHGRMRPEEKDSVMTQFRDGDVQILVSTSIVEVGVDISNATVMLIEGANRFGLAQLHQFRGRVGRGPAKAYCILIPDTPDTAENDRLAAMVETNDGFVLAERDLEQRGPGEFLGTRQAGYSELRMASITDIHLIEKARRQAQAIFEEDPDLTQPEHEPLAIALNRFWGGSGQGDIS
jgi:ATP-dependent DNA helicase RecG